MTELRVSYKRISALAPYDRNARTHKGRHDDQVDSVSQFLAWAGKRTYQSVGFYQPAILVELEEPEPPYRYWP